MKVCNVRYLSGIINNNLNLRQNTTDFVCIRISCTKIKSIKINQF